VVIERLPFSLLFMFEKFEEKSSDFPQNRLTHILTHNRLAPSGQVRNFIAFPFPIFPYPKPLLSPWLALGEALLVCFVLLDAV